MDALIAELPFIAFALGAIGSLLWVLSLED
jgi:hypothetical protein